MMISSASSRFAGYRRLSIIAMVGLTMVVCLGCVAGGLFWLVTPSYLGATLAQIERLEITTGQCLDKKGQPNPGPALYFSRVFVTTDDALTVANWFMQHGWSPMNRITGRGAFFTPTESKKYDLLIGRVFVYTGLLVARVDDFTTRIMMRSSVVVCAI